MGIPIPQDREFVLSIAEAHDALALAQRWALLGQPKRVEQALGMATRWIGRAERAATRSLYGSIGAAMAAIGK